MVLETLLNGTNYILSNMEEVYFAFDFKPKSYNSKQMEPYHNLLRELFERKYAHLYSNIPFKENVDIQTNLLYLDRTSSKSQMMDIDNISKPIIDSFCGVIYNDDKQVVRRMATHLRAISYNLTEIDVTDIPFFVYESIETVISGKKTQAVVLKVSKIDLKELKGKFL